MKEEEIGGVDLCHCTRALYHYSSLFLALPLNVKTLLLKFCSLGRSTLWTISTVKKYGAPGT